jgi:hypothetical protein
MSINNNYDNKDNDYKREEIISTNQQQSTEKGCSRSRSQFLSQATILNLEASK